MLNFIFIIARVVLANIVLRIEARRICKKLGIVRVPKIVLGQAPKYKMGYINGPDFVFINISKGAMPLWKETLRHELRHVWQWNHYSDILLWCLSKAEYRDNGDFYKFCPIELDARWYATGGNEKYSLLNFTPVDGLEEMYQNGTLLQQLRILSDIFHVPPAP